MAQLAIAAAGAGLGAATGIGANLGWVIGAAIGGFLFPANTTQKGPRLGDLTITSSAYGAPIPIPYGTIRTSGNVIWGPPIREKKNKAKVGGKGGLTGGATSITYSYFGSFAVAFGDGVAADLLRIWADGKLIYDRTGASIVEKKVALNFRFYTGAEDQLPDSLIESFEGEGNVSAHRGLVYIVFDDIPLADYGNRIPSITAEINYEEASPAAVTTTTSVSAFESMRPEVFLPDWTRRRIYSIDDNLDDIRAFSMDTLAHVGQLNDLGSNPILALNQRDGNIVVSAFVADPALRRAIQVLNPYTGTILRTDVSSSTGAQSGSTRVLSLNPLLGGAPMDLVITHNSGSIYRCHDYTTLTFAADITRPDSSFSANHLVHGIDGEMWATWVKSTEVRFFKITLTAGTNAFGEPIPVPVTTDYDPIVPADFGATAFTGALRFVHDKATDSILFAWEMTDRGSVAARWSPEVGIVWQKDVPFTLQNDGAILYAHGVSPYTRVQGGSWAYMDEPSSSGDTGGKIIRLDVSSGGMLTGFDGTTEFAGVGNGRGVWDDLTDSFYHFNNMASATRINKVKLNGADAVGALVSDIVSDIGTRVGFDPANDFDVTDLTDMTVPGYVISQPTQARDAVFPLAVAFFFDMVEIDYKLVYRERGDAIEETLSEQDFVDTSNGEGADAYSEFRAQEVELPRRFSVTYINAENDYQQDSQISQRVRAPDPFMRSDNQTNLTIPAAFTPLFAKQLSEKALYTAWRERTSFKQVLPWTYLYLAPTDPVEVSLDDGRTFRGRLLSSDLSGDYVMDTSIVSETQTQYASTILADSNVSFPQTITLIGPTGLFLLDIPLLRDVDTTPSTLTRMHYAMSDYGLGSWPGAELYRSLDHLAWVALSQALTASTWGIVTNTVGQPASYWMWDEVNTIVINVVSGADNLETATELDVLNGANVGAIIKQNGEVEIVQFQNVSAGAGNVYTLSRLLRGRRGSDTMGLAHSPPETFVLLDSDATESVIFASGDIGTPAFYRGVTFGQVFEEAIEESFTHSGRDLKPYAPVQVTATEDAGDIDFAWVRRTRLGGELVDGIGTVVVAEASESYELDILDAPGGAVLRTLSSTSPAVTYLAADITTDFGTLPATVDVVLYQMSAVVGRGFPRAVTVTVE